MKQKIQKTLQKKKSDRSREKKSAFKKNSALDGVPVQPIELHEEGEELEGEVEGVEEEAFEGSDEPSESELAASLPTVTGFGASEPPLSGLAPVVGLERRSQAHDPLKRYLEEVYRSPLLDAEQEFALGAQLQAEGRIEAAKALVAANLRLVVKIAFEDRTFYSNLLDLIQEGNIGLMKAVSKFDPTKGVRLGYYASWWIRSYILKYLLDNFRLVKIGTTQAQKKLFYHLMREKERLEAQGLLAGPKLLAEKLQVREKDVIEMEQRLSSRGSEMSLDVPISRDDGDSVFHGDTLVDDREPTDEVLAREELLASIRQQLPEFKKQLNEKELRILADRLLADEPRTLQEVADLYGLTRERARQIEVKVIEKLKQFIQPQF